MRGGIMNQRTHTWLAMRAYALLKETGDAQGLVKLLKPCIKSAAIGSWIPDMADSKKGSGDVDNHIFKLEPVSSRQTRFVLKKKDLFKKLGTRRKMPRFIEKYDSRLGAKWWDRPYKADPSPGEHLPNRAMSLAVTITDQLIFGDKDVAAIVPGSVRFATNLHPKALTTREQVATYFFMLSHFLADSCMPCHSDSRKLAAYNWGLHHELESHWSKGIGTYFEKRKLLKNKDTDAVVMKNIKAVDAKFGLKFAKSALPLIKTRDVWEDTLIVCRGSFALSNIIAPPKAYPFGSRKKALFEDLFEAGPEGDRMLKDLDAVVLHDAVMHIAIVWKDIWKQFKKGKKKNG